MSQAGQDNPPENGAENVNSHPPGSFFKEGYTCGSYMSPPRTVQPPTVAAFVTIPARPPQPAAVLWSLSCYYGKRKPSKEIKGQGSEAVREEMIFRPSGPAQIQLFR